MTEERALEEATLLGKQRKDLNSARGKAEEEALEEAIFGKKVGRRLDRCEVKGRVEDIQRGDFALKGEGAVTAEQMDGSKVILLNRHLHHRNLSPQISPGA